MKRQKITIFLIIFSYLHSNATTAKTKPCFLHNTHKKITIKKLLKTMGLSHDEIKNSTSQSANHMHLYFSEIFQLFKVMLQENNRFKNLFQSAYYYESNLAKTKQNKYVFYHAQKWELYWLSLLYTKLWTKKYAKNPTNYLFLRYPHYSIFSKTYNPETENFIHEKLITEGRIDCYRPKLLFMNCSFFGNITNLSSCTFCYFLINWNLGMPPITTKNIFSYLDYENLYEAHKEAIQNLEKQFYALSYYGNILQIVMPQSYMEKYVYLCSSGGYKSKAYVNNTETQNVSLILDTIKYAPNNIKSIDQFEFSWIVTHNAIKEAIDEVEVHCYHLADTEKITAIMDALDKLFT